MPRFQVIPRSHDFYELFDRAAANMAETAEMLSKLLVDFRDPEAAHAEIRQREHEGDEITHEIMRALNTTFVTPFDREDIHRLASSVDDILDGIGCGGLAGPPPHRGDLARDAAAGRGPGPCCGSDLSGHDPAPR